MLFIGKSENFHSKAFALSPFITKGKFIARPSAIEYGRNENEENFLSKSHFPLSQWQINAWKNNSSHQQSISTVLNFLSTREIVKLLIFRQFFRRSFFTYRAKVCALAKNDFREFMESFFFHSLVRLPLERLTLAKVVQIIMSSVRATKGETENRREIAEEKNLLKDNLHDFFFLIKTHLFLLLFMFCLKFHLHVFY